jgi:nitronate monooxygenase
MMRTRFTELFGLDYPILGAPMAMHSGATLATAVSQAGALGSFGGLHPFKGPDWVRDEIAAIRSKTDRPFAVGFINAFVSKWERHFEAALEARVPALVLSFGAFQPWLDRAKQSGARVICQVQAFDQAREAVAAGADVLVVQGNEAGGHTGTASLLPFLSRAVDEFPAVPVLAAGGIGDGRTLAGVLAAGAEGAILGTVLLATPEAVEVSEVHKQRVVSSDGHDTVYTEVFDILEQKIFSIKWPAGIASRAHRNKFAQQWHGHEDELRRRLDEIAPEYIQALERGDPEMTAVLMSAAAALVHAIRPAGEVVRTICQDAEGVLRDRRSER